MFKDLFVNLLQKQSVTAYKLSKDTGITEGLISQWKSGRQLPKYDNLKILCDYFNVSADYLLERTDIVMVKKSQPINTFVLDEVLTTYMKLDEVDKAEIKGTVKQMLKADKYSYRRLDTMKNTKEKAYNKAQQCVLRHLLKLFFEQKYPVIIEMGICGEFEQKINAVNENKFAVQHWLYNDSDDLFDCDRINLLISLTGYSLEELLDGTTLAFHLDEEIISNMKLDISCKKAYNAYTKFDELKKIPDNYNMLGRFSISLDSFSNLSDYAELAAEGGTETRGRKKKKVEILE